MATTETWLDLADPPAIDGLRFRRPRGDDADYEAMARVIGAASRVDDDPWLPTATNLREELEGSSGMDPARDVVVAEIDGTMVAQAAVDRALRGGEPKYDVHGHVLPEHRRRGIGRTLLHENLRRAIERGGEQGDPFPLTVRGWTSEREIGHQALLESEGFAVNRWFFLMRRTILDDIPDAPLPDGLELRPVLPEHHRAIFDAEFEAFLDHWQPHDYDEAAFEKLYKKADLDTSLWVVAWDGDDIAGVVQNWIWAEENEQLGVKRGWLEHISVRRPWRRRGLARAITAESLRRLRAAGMTDAMLGVDADNPTGALGLYEGLGFEVTQRSSAYVRSVEASPES
jgi:mycothiol synthase